MIVFVAQWVFGVCLVATVAAWFVTFFLVGRDILTEWTIRGWARSSLWGMAALMIAAIAPIGLAAWAYFR